MASIESSNRARRRNKSLKIKTSSTTSTSLINKASKILSSSKAIEVERIITRDGFACFPTSND